MLSSFHPLAALAGIALSLATLSGCSLNPQPLPPGEQSDGAVAGFGGDATISAQDGGSQFGGADAGRGGGDGATPGAPPPEAGEAGDSGPAQTDASSDAPGDAPTDATTRE